MTDLHAAHGNDLSSQSVFPPSGSVRTAGSPLWWPPWSAEWPWPSPWRLLTSSARVSTTSRWMSPTKWVESKFLLVILKKWACFADLLCVTFRDAFTADFWTACWKCAKPRVCWGYIRGWARSSFVWPHTQSSACSSGTCWDNRRWKRVRATEAAKTPQTKWSTT